MKVHTVIFKNLITKSINIIIKNKPYDLCTSKSCLYGEDGSKNESGFLLNINFGKRS